MKTRNSLRTFAGMAFTTAALFLSAASTNANETEIQSALDNLEKLNMSIEKSIRYTLPEIAGSEISETDAVYYLDMSEAELDARVKYQAPEVTEDMEAYELKAAFERLDGIFNAIDESIKF